MEIAQTSPGNCASNDRITQMHHEYKVGGSNDTEIVPNVSKQSDNRVRTLSTKFFLL